jgi:pilus assembly protein CpaB
MRWAAAFLIVLGLVAAVSAALLVRVITMPTPAERAAEKGDTPVEVLVAKHNIEAPTLVSGDSVTTKTMLKSQVTPDMITNPVQVVGRILTNRVVEGAVFRESAFKRDKAMHLASHIKAGKRAVSVQLREWSAMAGLLSYGSIVDVLVSVNSSAGAGSNQTISTTLLQGLQVLAVGSQSVVSDEEFEDRQPGALASRGQYQQRMVTLLVDPRQAELLQLAMQHGSISLAMRNPLDQEHVAQRITRMTDISGASLARPGRIVDADPDVEHDRANAVSAADGGGDIFASGPEAGADENSGEISTPEQMWEMLIIRGSDTETQKFPLPEKNDDDEGDQISGDHDSSNDAAVDRKADG